jgi:hypothetical protein
MTHAVDWHGQLFEQLDWHWRTSARPRLDGLTDDEYRWEPVPGCRNVRLRGTGTAPIEAGRGPFTCDFAEREPEPAPVTTIAWRLAHVTVGCFGARTASHFGGPAYDTMTYAYPGDGATALAALDTTYAAWRDAVRSLDADALPGPRSGRASLRIPQLPPPGSTLGRLAGEWAGPRRAGWRMMGR